MIEVYKIFRGLEDIVKGKFFTVNPRISRGNKHKIYKNPVCLDMKRYSFSNRVVNDWNQLPDSIMAAVDLSNFKSKLHNYLRLDRRLE